MRRDLKKFAKQTDVQLIAGGLLILFIFGDGLIFFLYGPSSAIFGLLCMGVGIIPIIIIYLVFLLIDWIVKNAHEGD
jgi:hypothetical protein